MLVIVSEHGDRPVTRTKARAIAPQAAKYLADLLHEETFAERAVIVIDWRGDFLWKGDGPMPEELMVPFMYVVTEKFVSKYNNAFLRCDYRLELEDFFGHDNATKDDLHEIVENLKVKTRQEENR